MKNRNDYKDNLRRRRFLLVLKFCAMEKAAGPDGVPMVFFLLWEMLKEDIITTVQFFHSNQVFERSFNATIKALIPNKIGAVDL